MVPDGRCFQPFQAAVSLSRLFAVAPARATSKSREAGASSRRRPRREGDREMRSSVVRPLRPGDDAATSSVVLPVPPRLDHEGGIEIARIRSLAAASASGAVMAFPQLHERRQRFRGCAGCAPIGRAAHVQESQRPHSRSSRGAAGRNPCAIAPLTACASTRTLPRVCASSATGST